MGPAYWANLTFASDGSIYLGLNHGSGAGLGMLSASFGVIPKGNAEKVFTGPGGSTGVSYFGVGVNGQGNNGGYAVDAGASMPGVYAGMGYGFKIWDPNWGDQVSTSFHDKQGNPLPRCTQ